MDIKKQRVFLHDMTGVSRAPTVYLCYQALYLNFKDSIQQMQINLRKDHNMAMANVEIVEKVI